MAGLCTLLIAIISVVAASLAGKPQEALVPAGKLTARGLFEVSVESLAGLTENIIGHDFKLYLPITGSLFIYIFINNTMGLFPGFSPATDNLNTTLSIGL